MTTERLPKIVIAPAKRRFGRIPRKQWRATAFAANGGRLSFQDSYANIGDVRAMLELLRGPVELEIYYADGVRRELLR